MSYPEVINNNMDILKEKHIDLILPFFSFESKEILYKTVFEEFERFGISKSEAKMAVDAAMGRKI